LLISAGFGKLYETFISQIAAFPMANHIWLDLTPILT
jgi:hypothetical protein